MLTRSGFRTSGGGAVEGGVGDVTALTVSEQSVADQTLGAWALMAKPIRTLVAIDVSASMDYPAAGGKTRMQLTTAAALAGNQGLPRQRRCRSLGVFPRYERNPGLPGIGADQALRHDRRRCDSTKVDGRSGETGSPNSNVAPQVCTTRRWPHSVRFRNRTIRGAVNSVIILTDGANEDPDSISREQLLDVLAREQDPARPVIIVTIGITDDADAAALADISRVTGGSTYIARDPSEISEVFVNALAHRGT